eukprot:3601322-Pyramimonas_sp.AAC.1
MQSWATGVPLTKLIFYLQRHLSKTSTPRLLQGQNPGAAVPKILNRLLVFEVLYWHHPSGSCCPATAVDALDLQVLREWQLW